MRDKIGHLKSAAVGRRLDFETFVPALVTITWLRRNSPVLCEQLQDLPRVSERKLRYWPVAQGNDEEVRLQ